MLFRFHTVCIGYAKTKSHLLDTQLVQLFFGQKELFSLWSSIQFLLVFTEPERGHGCFFLSRSLEIL